MKADFMPRTPGGTPETAIRTPVSEVMKGTPKSVSCTPSTAEIERETPEDSEIVENTSSPRVLNGLKAKLNLKSPKPYELILPKPPEPPAPIAEGFASWIPKEKLSAPAPLLNAFGLPIEMEKPEPKQETPVIPPSQVPAPWEKTNNINPKGSSALALAAARVEAADFLGGSTLPKARSRALEEVRNREDSTGGETMSKRAKKRERKEIMAKMRAVPEMKFIESASSSPVQKLPPLYGESMKKIPKKSSAPTPATNSDDEPGTPNEIPGLSLLKPSLREEDAGPSFSPSASTFQEVSSIPARSRNSSTSSTKPPLRPAEIRGNPFGIQPAVRKLSPLRVTPEMTRHHSENPRPAPFIDRRGPTSNCTEWTDSRPLPPDRSFSYLPWHRTSPANHQPPRQQYESPFGIVTYKNDDSWGRPFPVPESHRRDESWNRSSSVSFFSRPSEQPQDPRFGPKRSFWE
ncbi:unnamed protein product [Caenorhabditis bovis]|nr:unnamed protein product [Caenorhabditis bovis]